MKTSRIIAYIFATIALIFEGLFGIIPFLSFLTEVLLTSVGILLLFAIFRRSTLVNWKENLQNYIRAILATFGFFISIFLIFIGYQNATPGILSDIELSHSGQSIVFVEMSHIATEDFYNQKKKTIQNLVGSGYTILVEGVKPGSQANQEIFNRSMGFDFTPTLYKELANLIGLKNQDNTLLFAGINTGSLVSVDLSIDDIVNAMGTGSMVGSGEMLDLEGELQKVMKTISQHEKKMISWIARGFLNWSLKQSGDVDALVSSGPQSKLYSAIIDRRDQAVVEYIQKNPNQKIAIVYGALHFNGIFEALQKNKNWSAKIMSPIAPYQK